jgi:NAD(P)-dependent dehydrogenase (short-subunit alcohol dehydrogenase family)
MVATVSRLSNKVAIVTGASKGIGSGIAMALGAAGARVGVNYATDREGAERVAACNPQNLSKRRLAPRNTRGVIHREWSEHARSRLRASDSAMPV